MPEGFFLKRAQVGDKVVLNENGRQRLVVIGGAGENVVTVGGWLFRRDDGKRAASYTNSAPHPSVKSAFLSEPTPEFIAQAEEQERRIEFAKTIMEVDWMAVPITALAAVEFALEANGVKLNRP